MKKVYLLAITLAITVFILTDKGSKQVSFYNDDIEQDYFINKNPITYTFPSTTQKPTLKSSELEFKTNLDTNEADSLAFGYRTKTLEIYHALKDLPDTINIMKEDSHNPLKDISKSYKVNLPHVLNPRYGVSLNINNTLLQGKNPLIKLETSFSFEGEDIFPAYTVLVKRIEDMQNPILEKTGVKKSKLAFRLNSQLAAGDYIIQIEAKPNGLNSKYPLMASTSFKVSPRFTKYLKESKDEIDSNGNFHYKAKYKVMTKGPYVFEAVINTADGTPIALIENVVRLKEGINWVDLPIHGYMFHKLNQTGSFTITHQRLRKVKANLSLWSDKTQELDYETRSYSLSEFNSSPYENKVLLDKIKRISQAN